MNFDEESLVPMPSFLVQVGDVTYEFNEAQRAMDMAFEAAYAGESVMVSRVRVAPLTGDVIDKLKVGEESDGGKRG